MRTCLMLLLCATLAAAADWPGFRGPERTGLSAEAGLLKAWPGGAPKLLWQSDKAGLGYAGLAVVGGTVYTMGARGEDEYLLALDDKGQEKWAAKIGPLFDFKANQWSRGPNATPTVDGDRIYALSSKGMLLCAGRDGKPAWKLDLVKELDGEINNEAPGGVDKFGWGHCWSPLVDGDQLVLTPGGPKGLFAALDKKTGKPLWRSTAVKDQATYASPVVATIGGTKQYITQTEKGAVGVDARDGRLLWRFERPEEYTDVVCPTPIVKGDRVYTTVGESGTWGNLIKLAGSGGKFTVEPVWSNGFLNNYHSGVVLVGEHLYGFNNGRGHWVCQEFATGQVAWPKGRTRQSVKAGGMVAAEGRLYVLDDAGTVAMLEASPKAYKVISQFKLPAQSKARKISGKVWTHPSLSDGKLYLRDQELVFCYQVK